MNTDQLMKKNTTYFLIAILNLLAGISFFSVGILGITPDSERRPYIWFIIAALFLVTSYLNFRKYTAKRDEQAIP